MVNSPKQFVLQLGALIALYVSLTALIVLCFSIINLHFPDAATAVYEDESARTAIRSTIAVLLVFFPTHLVLTRIGNKIRRRESGGTYTSFARWLIFISLLVAGGILLVDLVILINYFLNGEITPRFLAKVAVLLVLVGTAFTYYLLDVRNYFKDKLQQAYYFGSGALLVVVLALVFGYQYIETPQAVRERRIDEQQVSDLQQIQSYIENYYLTEKSLPNDLATAYKGFALPTAPAGRSGYTYKVTDEQNYELCANFATESTESERSYMSPEQNFNWLHKAGEWCFARTVTTTMKPI